MKNKFFQSTTFAVFIIVFAFFSGRSAADTLLDVPEIAQQHSQWCWAGSSRATLDYYETFVSQCEMANWAWGRSDCCGNSNFNWYHSCNQPNYMYGTAGSLQGILGHWGVNSNEYPYALSFPTCVSQIDAGRPFVIRFGWTSGGGHFLVGYGYNETGHLDYMDPWPGHGYTRSLYSWVVSASDHDWTHTLQITTNPPVWNLNVSSTNPVGGVPVAVSPSDKSGLGDGTTQFSRIYDNKSSVTLTAPASAGGNLFKSWTGCNGTTGVTCTATLRSDRTVTANYVTPGEPIEANLLKNPSFEGGHKNWAESSSGGYYLISEIPSSAHEGNYFAWFGGLNYLKEKLSQDVKIPIDATQAYLQFYYSISTDETELDVYDTFKIEIRNPADNRVLQLLDTFNNLTPTSGWTQSVPHDLISFKGKKIRLTFRSSTDHSYPTDFLVDNVRLMVTTQVNVLVPNGGESIPAGSPYDIRWSAPPEAVRFALKYSANNGQTWKILGKNFTGSSYSWSVPLSTKTKCLIQVIAYDANGLVIGSDKSDVVFTIQR